MENQQKVITFGALGEYDNLRPQVKPVKATYRQMKEMREQGKLIPGQLYRITDYVTTVNGATITNARSAGHPFDIIVMATATDTLSEDALAVRHEGDTYFKDSRPEAWQLKYLLDNVQWSKQAGTYVTDEDNGYTFQVIGDITLSGHTYQLLQGFGMYIEDWSDYALMETVAEGEQIICYYGDPEDFDPEEPEEVGTASGVETVTEEGKGTIIYMKDEFGNEAGYDFKNIQFKRWKVTDELERENINGHYIGILNNLSDDKQSIEDESDFIWCYTFAMPIDGSQGTSDFSLRGDRCFNNRFFPQYSAGSPVLYDNVMLAFAEDSTFYDNTFSGNDFSNNTFSGNSIHHNTFSGNNISYNTFSGNTRYCIFGFPANKCTFTAQNTSQYVQCVETCGQLENQTVTVPGNSKVAIYVGMNSSNQLKIWKPADLAQ